jgi:WD40 repeat protein
VFRRFLGVFAAIGLSTSFASAQDPQGAPTHVGTPSKDASEWISAFACSPDGKTIAMGRYNLKIELWDLESNRPLRTLFDPGTEPYNRFGKGLRVDDLAFSPDGKYVAAVAYGLGLRVWDAKTGDLSWRYPERERTLAAAHEALEFSRDGKLLVTVKDFTGAMDLWDFAGKTHVATITGHKQGVNSLALSPDATSLYSCSMDLTVRKWDVATRKEVWRLGTESEERSIGPTFPQQLRLSPDGKHLAVTYHGCWQLGAQLVDPETGKVIRDFEVQHSDSLAFMPGQNVFVLQGSEGRPVLIDADARKRKTRFPARALDRIMRMAFTPDGARLLATRNDGALAVWDLSRFEPLKD